jgi:HlyD family secretion protein
MFKTLTKRSTIETATTGTAIPGIDANGKQQSTTQTVVTQIKKRKQRKRNAIIGIVALVVVVIGLAIANGGKEKSINVQTETVSRRTITSIVQATGKIQPEVKVKISPEVSGEIIDLPIKEGQQVTRGQLLAKIKPTTFEAAHEQGMASLNASKARMEQSRANMITAKQAFNRSKELRDKNLISASDYEAAEAQYQVAQANFNASNFEIKATESQLKQLTESLRKTAVIAPMGGVVTSLVSELGETVVGTSQFSGTEMMTVSDLAVMNAEVEVDENDVVNVSIGDKANITIDAYPGRIFRGTIVEIANSAKLKGMGTQEQSTNFEVKIRIDDFKGVDLRPGMSCIAKIETETKENVMAVPMIAVTRRDKSDDPTADSIKRAATGGEVPTIVFINDNGKAKAVPVKTGLSDNLYVEILSGLSGNEEIIKGNYSAVSKELQDKKAIKVENKSTTKSASDTKASN